MNDAVNPALVPKKKLYNGYEMPCIGMGTFGSDHVTHDTVAEAVIGAAEVGFRLFDCASVYGNEDKIGVSFEKIMKSGISRDELFIMSKVWNDSHKDVIGSCKKSLHDLKLDYLDGYFVHWPFPNFHPPHCDIDSRSPDARPYIHEEFMETWRQMEKLHKDGLVRSLGVSNVTVSKLEKILRDAEIKPALNEMELHPSFQQPELFDFCTKNDIQQVGYCPVGSPNRPERDIDPDDVIDTQMPEILKIAENHGIHPAVVCLKWAVQNGQIPIPFSVTRKNYTANLKAVTEDPLTDDEMAIIRNIDKNCRFIKGHVFLWESAKGWEDLWE